MKKFSEMDELFKQLNDIPRSHVQKEETLRKVLSSSNVKRRKNRKQVIWSLLAFAACFMLAVVVFNGKNIIINNRQSEAIQLLEINSSDIVSFKAVSLEHMNVDEEDLFLQPHVVEIKNDHTWEEELSNILNHCVEIKKAPNSKPIYKILITLKNDKSLVMDVWTEEKKVYLKETNSDFNYEVSKDHVKYLQAILEEMT
ncbi:hypothetical protein K6959_04520 [Bacillus aquiflavi]|uniref:hypothetical protein n=1 Tax=Bacillus aquiflavi TaxID=2672567 RepID=UPI001CA9586F|nr:hypothetical protein [Bacillus aquiflavi]UAC49158.1 hypothetical protein K6959_04520 [Bacillus aquiflavi]